MTTIQTGQVIPATQINQWCPAGVIQPYGGTAAPSGWFICDGSAVLRSTYSDLFAAIGTLWGAGDGSTTFNLPDLRGRTLVGYAPSGGHTDVSTLGSNDGVAVANRRAKHRHTPHSHGITDAGHHHQDQTANGAGAALTTSTNTSGATANQPVRDTTTATTGISINNADGGSGNSNDSLDAPAYGVVNFIIRAKDV